MNVCGLVTVIASCCVFERDKGVNWGECLAHCPRDSVRGGCDAGECLMYGLNVALELDKRLYYPFYCVRYFEHGHLAP
jgi:hypothetical protein